MEDDEIEDFYKILTKREEIDQIFSEHSGPDEVMSLDHLARFLREEQHEEGAGPELALSLIQRYEPNETGRLATLGGVEFVRPQPQEDS